MKAIDLIKSITFSGVDADNLSVITQYRNQELDTFIKANLGDVIKIKPDISPLNNLESQDYLAIQGVMPMRSPDGGLTVLKPDYSITRTDNSRVLLYKID